MSARPKKIKKGGAFLRGRAVALGLGLSLAAAWLFYDSVWGLLWGILFFPLCGRLCREAERDEKKRAATLELKETLLLLSSYLQTGYSLEYAFRQAESELGQMMEKNALGKELHELNQKVGMNLPVEKAFYELAEKIDVEEAYEFAEILLFAKRLGGNYNRNIQKAAEKIEDRMEICQEIALMTAEKQLEMRIMTAMPLAMILYMKLSSAEFLSGLYHNAAGVGIMTGCLLLYLLMYLAGRKITKIEV